VHGSSAPDVQTNEPFEPLHWEDTRKRFAHRTCRMTQSHRQRGTAPHPSPFGRLYVTRANTAGGRLGESTGECHEGNIANKRMHETRQKECQTPWRMRRRRHVSPRLDNGDQQHGGGGDGGGMSAPMPFRLGAIFSSSFSVKNSDCTPYAGTTRACQDTKTKRGTSNKQQAMEARIVCQCAPGKVSPETKSDARPLKPHLS